MLPPRESTLGTCQKSSRENPCPSSTRTAAGSTAASSTCRPTPSRSRRRRGPEQIRLDRVVRIEKPDSLANGAWIGFAVGAGMGLLGAVSANTDDIAFVASAVITNALVTTACGVGFDALVDNRRTLYQRDGRVAARVAPIVAPGVRGAAVTVRW